VALGYLVLRGESVNIRPVRDYSKLCVVNGLMILTLYKRTLKVFKVLAPFRVFISGLLQGANTTKTFSVRENTINEYSYVGYLQGAANLSVYNS